MQEILNNFPLQGKIQSITESNSGLINNTYFINCESEKYVLQKINTNVFNKPEELMKNIDFVINHLKNSGYKTLEIIKNKNGKLFSRHNNENWRVYRYIESQNLDKVDNIKIVNECAKELARFHRTLITFPINKLKESIKDFHNTPVIFQKFQDTLLNSSNLLIEKSREQISYILSKQDDCNIISNLLAKNKIPLRVCHYDPKISNFLFDSNLNALCLIDLDTVMPGTFLTDISDAIRTICVTGDEQEKEISKIHFKDDYFKHFISTYLNQNIKNLNIYEVKNIINAVDLIFLEQGIRFLDDYLNGNKYFKIRYKDHNLIRAKNQLYLSKIVSSKKKYLEEIISNTLNKISHNL